jgi:homoserine dehydrogenase
MPSLKKKMAAKRAEIPCWGYDELNPIDENIVSSDLDVLLRDPTVKVAIELVGGTTVAKDIVKKLIMSGKHVVTANKALLAHYGQELFELARKYDKIMDK